MLPQKWDEMLRDGFMETGDVMEQRGPNTVVWIDRKKNIMKLSQVTTLLFWQPYNQAHANATPVRIWRHTSLKQQGFGTFKAVDKEGELRAG